MAPKPPITDEEFDLLDRAIYRYAVDPRGLSLEGSDRDTARRLVELNYVTIRGGRALPNDPGLAAASDYENFLEGSQTPRDPLTAEEFGLLEKIIEREKSAEDYEVGAGELALARVLARRRLIRLENRRAEPERRGHRAIFTNRERLAVAAYEDARPTSAGEALEVMLAALDARGKLQTSEEFGLMTRFVMRQRQRLGRQLQVWAEATSPLDHCGPDAWQIASTPSPELRELQSIRCGGSDKAPRLIAAGLAEKVNGALRLTSRPHRWHITQAGHLRIDGVDVASGATLGLRALGTFLHDMDYPKVKARELRAFRLGQPGEAHGLMSPSALSKMTVSLIGELSHDGGTEAGAGVYLGVSAVQWRRHAQASDGRPGPWAMHVLRMLPAHPRVVTWVLEYEEPLGRAVVTELLEHLGRHGLAKKHGADWRRTAAGERASRAEEPIDPYELWIARHRDELDRLDNAGADFLASLRRQLRERARDAGRSWPTKDTVRSRHLSSVLRQATQRGLSHGCELAHALWSRTVLELTQGVS